MTDIAIYRKRLERLEEVLGELIEHSEKGAVIIVEGKRDILSLKKLGVRGNFEIGTHSPLINLSEQLASPDKDIILLTDWDRRGDLLASKLSTHFNSLGVRPDLQIRNKLKLITQKEIKDVESLYTYVSKMRAITGQGNEKS